MKKKITLILLIMFFTGLSVLLYPSISQFWNSKKQSEAIANYENVLAKVDENEIEDMFHKANEYNEDLRKLDSPLLEFDKVSGYENLLNLNKNGMIGYIGIDKLKVELPIYHGISDAVLNSAAGHIQGSSLPIGGTSTHAVISAHRGLPSAKLFTDLDKMEIGDIFTIVVLDEVFTYQVDQIKIVLPDDIRDINVVQGEDYVTLLTCTPYGINSHRLLVRGTRIENIVNKQRFINSEAYLVDRLIVTSVIALPILLGLILYVVFKPASRKEEDIDEI